MGGWVTCFFTQQQRLFKVFHFFILGAGVGVDGVHASVAGFGFRFGPKMEIKTPVVDVSCSVM